eukprot:299436-Pelagomonas_calceolata.AAC.2
MAAMGSDLQLGCLAAWLVLPTAQDKIASGRSTARSSSHTPLCRPKSPFLLSPFSLLACYILPFADSHTRNALCVCKVTIPCPYLLNTKGRPVNRQSAALVTYQNSRAISVRGSSMKKFAPLVSVKLSPTRTRVPFLSEAAA